MRGVVLSLSLSPFYSRPEMGLRDLLSLVVPFAGSNDPEEAFAGAFSALPRADPRRTEWKISEELGDRRRPVGRRSGRSNEDTSCGCRIRNTNGGRRTPRVRDPFEEPSSEATSEDSRFRIFLGDFRALDNLRYASKELTRASLPPMARKLFPVIRASFDLPGPLSSNSQSGSFHR